MACIDMQQRLAELREKWGKTGMPELKMRIGLCTGPAVVGNMGSKNRMDYTMMGDTVNIAARLEGVNKVCGTYTMIADATYQNAGDWIRPGSWMPSGWWEKQSRSKFTKCSDTRLTSMTG